MGLMIVAVPLLVHGVVMFIGVYAVMFVAAKAVLGREERRHGPLRERGDGIDPPFFELRLSVTVIGCLTLSTLVGVSPDQLRRGGVSGVATHAGAVLRRSRRDGRAKPPLWRAPGCYLARYHGARTEGTAVGGRR